MQSTERDAAPQAAHILNEAEPRGSDSREGALASCAGGLGAPLPGLHRASRGEHHAGCARSRGVRRVSSSHPLGLSEPGGGVRPDSGAAAGPRRGCGTAHVARRRAAAGRVVARAAAPRDRLLPARGDLRAHLGRSWTLSLRRRVPEVRRRFLLHLDPPLRLLPLLRAAHHSRDLPRGERCVARAGALARPRACPAAGGARLLGAGWVPRRRSVCWGCSGSAARSTTSPIRATTASLGCGKSSASTSGWSAPQAPRSGSSVGTVDPIQGGWKTIVRPHDRPPHSATPSPWRRISNRPRPKTPKHSPRSTGRAS